MNADLGALASFRPLAIIGIAYLAIVAGLMIAGRPSRHPSAVARFVTRIPNGMQRITGIPGWAACAVGMTLLSLLTAGIGFYSDVSWHVYLGRDKGLFTAPHVMILTGLGGIAMSAVLGSLFASLTQVETTIRWRGVRVPWSMGALALLGSSALVGFPLDEMWHRQYGVDVTMWSPTHLLLIVGAALSPIPCWLALAEAGVKREDGAFAKVARVLTTWLMLMGLAAVLGEFEFGVPQFQQMYHPVLIAVAAGFAFSVARIVLGPGRALLVGVLGSAMRFGDLLGSGDGRSLQPRAAALFIGCAAAVELAALLLGTKRRLRFAAASGVAIATIGLGTEWMWNQNALQPWTTALLPEAVLLGALAATGAAILGVAFATALNRERTGLRWPIVVLGAVAVLAAIAIPLPRKTGDVRVAMHLETSAESAVVRVTIDPPDAAKDARWFQAMSWQGGGLVLADMVEEGEGRYVSDKPVPITGHWKTVVRLHRGAELMSVPVRFPADSEIGKGDIPAEDRTMDFAPEQRYLLRESRPGPAWFALIAYLIIGGIATAWFGSIAFAAYRIRREPEAAKPRTMDAWVSAPRISTSTRP